MKTVGQIFSTARQKRNLSIDQLSHLTKIDSRYIDALERDNYSRLPSETFAKGFIRNLSQRLDLSPSEMVAIFRRDYRHPQPSAPTRRLPRLILPDHASPIWPFVVGGIVFITYLIFQFRAIVVPPKLSLSHPAAQAVLVSPVEIEGDTSPDATVYINQDTKITPNSSGHFLAKINLPPGETMIEIKTVNRFSRSSSQKISVTVVSR